MLRALPPIALTLVLLISCSDETEGPSPSGPSSGISIAAQKVATGLERPLYLTTPPEDDRLFVVEQRGTIRVVQDGEVQDDPYLDLRTRVRSGGEQGLLSLAFHPSFAENGRFFVNFTGLDGDTRVERFVVDPTVTTVQQKVGQLVLEVEQPFSNHNGGLLKFGPDGMFYIGLGDGGAGGDPHGNGQDPTTLLGSMLRVDVDEGDPYEVPPDNPFIGEPGRNEVFAYGLRNPWRFAFDHSSNLLYVADAGESSWEEVNVISTDRRGVNFGWNVMEGAHCFQSDSCNKEGLELPVVEYSTDEGCAVIGGEVYGGTELPELRGQFFYADHCSLRLRSFIYVGGEAIQRHSWDVGDLGQPLGFGKDSRGELYLLTRNGSVYRFVRDST